MLVAVLSWSDPALQFTSCLYKTADDALGISEQLSSVKVSNSRTPSAVGVSNLVLGCCCLHVLWYEYRTSQERLDTPHTLERDRDCDR